MEFNAKKVKDDIVKWIQDFFEENGKGCNAIVGISGGKDSSVVAALCVEALGKERTIGVLMPQGTQPDIDYSRMLCDHLGIENYTVDIFQACKSIKHQVSDCLQGNWSLQSSTNLPARIRMATLYAFSQTLNGRVANTCNLSEDWVGYATRYGDAAGDFSPLSRLTVTEVKAIGRVLGLPSELVDKVPTDGLCGKTDEDNLGFSYDVLDRYIRTGEIDSEELKQKIDAMHKKNLFKLQLMPCFEYTERYAEK
ncbi:MAG TPA: NAD(+) synthase [Lachnospiraceae bacterium]|nr:NAD(+) synthase [Lachnospiraceae bacterium]